MVITLQRGVAEGGFAELMGVLIDDERVN